MGAWGTGNFENDDALDWVSELEQAEDATLVEETLKVVAERGDEYLDSPDACRALAAAEVIAAFSRKDGPGLPDSVKQWINGHELRSSDFVPLAMRAIERVKTSSELKDLWDESESREEWYAVIKDLEMRLH